MKDGEYYLISIRTPDSYRQVVVRTYDYDVTLHEAKTQNQYGDAISQRRIQLRLVTTGDAIADYLTLTNCGESSFVVSGVLLKPGDSARVDFPINLAWEQNALVAFLPLSERTIQQHCTFSTEHTDQNSPSPLVGDRASMSSRSMSEETLVQWFSALASVQRQAACTDAFYAAAVRAMVDPGGLDVGLLLRREVDEWKLEHLHSIDPHDGIAFEPHFADLVCRSRKSLVLECPTIDSSTTTNETSTLFGAPVFDAQMNAVAVLYGKRHQSEGNRRRRIRNLESLWLRLLAESLTTGIIRSEHESKALRQRALLEQAFPAKFIGKLCQHSTIHLPTEEREITILFADLIDSSSLCEKHAPELTFEFLSDFMDALTSVVHQHDGAVVDYYGDGLIAMWNAPVDQPHHAELACRTGLAIQKQLTVLNATWSYRLKQAIDVGIGIHTGNAIVGNSGSRDRPKYGPRGFAINVAHRLEKATRSLKQSLLISDETRLQLPQDISSFRLGQFKLWGIGEPIVIHALHSMTDSNATNPCCVSKHQDVVRLMEQGKLVEATQALDRCSGCAFDDLSLQVIQHHLQSLSEIQIDDSGLAPRVGEPVFDLTRQ